MFDKERYITSGINTSAPLQVQSILWQAIDNLKKSNEVELDYLQVFRLKEKNKVMSKEAKVEILKLFYSLNLLENMAVSAHKQANFYKVDSCTGAMEYLFYYGIIDMKEIEIEDYINKLDIDMKIYGGSSGNSNEYIYIGRMQQFKHASIKSKKFALICAKLGLPLCDCIKIHYLEIDKLINVLRVL